jgi:hypothetical protein
MTIVYTNKGRNPHKEDMKLGKRIKPEVRQVMKKAPIFSDKEQKALNKAVDDRYAVKLAPPKVYRPGHPEFDEIAATITHVSKIVSDKSKPFIEDDYSHYHAGRRNESSTTI